MLRKATLGSDDRIDFNFRYRYNIGWDLNISRWWGGWLGGLIQKIMPLYLKIGWFFQIGRVWQQVKVNIYKFSVTQHGLWAWLGLAGM